MLLAILSRDLCCVVQLQRRFPAKEVLKLGHEGDLRLHPHVEMVRMEAQIALMAELQDFFCNMYI